MYCACDCCFNDTAVLMFSVLPCEAFDYHYQVVLSSVLACEAFTYHFSVVVV